MGIANQTSKRESVSGPFETTETKDEEGEW